jgi:DNA phosphorothioation-associated putative methyltransferase
VAKAQATTTQGKLVAGRLYAHLELLPLLPDSTQQLVTAAQRYLPPNAIKLFNIVRVNIDDPEVAFLHYPDFYEDAFPALRESWKVRTDTGHVVYRTYEQSLNPPILHRKELLLPSDHPAREAFEAITKAAEDAGLFQDTTRIGFKYQWENLLQRAGLTVQGHDLIPLANDLRTEAESDQSLDGPIARHLTALSRNYLSVPVQSVIRHGLLHPGVTLFDYGCGKGDDVRNLSELGFPAAGWDPHYCPDNERTSADIVNLGFVINVIEDFDERCEAIEKAFALTEKLLVVAGLIGVPPSAGVRRHTDGVITSRKTFQKYYSSGELLQFVSAVLDQDALPAAPGVVYAFKDRAMETNYLVQRYSSRNRVARALLPSVSPRPRSVRVARPKPHRELPAEVTLGLQNLWQLYLELGRRPDPAEVGFFADLLGHFRTVGRVFRYVEASNDSEALARSATARRDDILVGLALQLFARRKRFRDFDERLRLDIKAFFGTYDQAQREAMSLLHGISDVSRLMEQRDTAAAAGLGYIDDEGHLQLHVDLVRQLPALLRVFAGAATTAYGDLASADLIKLHVGTGKVTLMAFDDFIGSPLPRMTQRIKMDMREQDLRVFEYGEAYEPPYLYWKSRYINEETPNYAEQVAFDEQLAGLELGGESAYGLSPDDLHTALECRRLAIDGFQLIRSRRIPDLDEKCGRYLTYRQLIECGETWEATQLDNRPKLPDSYTALYDLAINVLDPVIEYYGMIRLTYGFSCSDLTRHIKGRIAPKLDQHAAHELSQRGSLVCSRRGAAVDFLVEDEDMREVANWLSGNTDFDRIYFYGPDRPIHVSYGPAVTNSVIEMRTTASGRLMPRQVTSGHLEITTLE